MLADEKNRAFDQRLEARLGGLRAADGAAGRWRLVRLADDAFQLIPLTISEFQKLIAVFLEVAINVPPRGALAVHISRPSYHYFLQGLKSRYDAFAGSCKLKQNDVIALRSMMNAKSKDYFHVIMGNEPAPLPLVTPEVVLAVAAEVPAPPPLAMPEVVLAVATEVPAPSVEPTSRERAGSLAGRFARLVCLPHRASGVDGRGRSASVIEGGKGKKARGARSPVSPELSPLLVTPQASAPSSPAQPVSAGGRAWNALRTWGETMRGGKPVVPKNRQRALSVGPRAFADGGYVIRQGQSPSAVPSPASASPPAFLGPGIAGALLERGRRSSVPLTPASTGVAAPPACPGVGAPVSPSMAAAGIVGALARSSPAAASAAVPVAAVATPPGSPVLPTPPNVIRLPFAAGMGEVVSPDFRTGVQDRRGQFGVSPARRGELDADTIAVQLFEGGGASAESAPFLDRVEAEARAATASSPREESQKLDMVDRVMSWF